MSINNEIFKKALVATGSSFIPFREEDIFNGSVLKQGIKTQDYPFISWSKLSNIPCPKCRQNIEVVHESKSVFCSKCGHSQLSSITPRFVLSINPAESDLALKNIFKTKIDSSKFKILDSYSEMYVCDINGKKIAILLDMGTKNLSDYYKLVGYSNQKGPANHVIMISHAFEPDLINLSIKSKVVSLFSLESIFDDFNGLIEKSFVDLKISEESNKALKFSTIEFQEDMNILEISKNLSNLLDNVEKWALQSSTETGSMQGKLFEKAIVQLLNLSLFQARLVAGNNAQDGIIYSQNNGKTTWFPFEVKSFTPEKNNFYKIRDAYDQIEKYSKALTHSEMKRQISCPCFLIIAYDFNKDDKDNLSVLLELERKYNMKYVMLPLKSILKLLNLHLSKIKSQAVIPIEEVIESFFLKESYIDENQVEELYKELESYSNERFAPQVELLRKLVEKRA